MKFLRVSALHYASLKKIPYQNNPNLRSKPYDHQLKELFSYGFHYSDSLTHCLQKFGYETAEIVCDAETLQKKWATEHAISFRHDRWEDDILTRQIQAFKPDILYLHNVFSLSLKRIQHRKEIFPFLKCLILFRGYPEMNRTLFLYLSTADVLLVGSPALAKICEQNGLKPHLFYHYFDERITSHFPSEPSVRYPFTFLGTTGFGYGWNHQPRYHFLKELLKTSELKCWVDEPSLPFSPWKKEMQRVLELIFSWMPQKTLEQLNEHCHLFSAVRKLAFNGLARKLSQQNRYYEAFPHTALKALFPMQCHPPVFGIEMHKILASSQVTFNKHAFAAMGTVDNIRMFEATGAGACLLTDMGSNLSDLFEMDREIVAYSSLEECQEKLKFLLSNGLATARIALQGQKRTLRDHTALARARQIHEIMSSIRKWD